MLGYASFSIHCLREGSLITLNPAGKDTDVKEPPLLYKICVTVVLGQQAHCCILHGSIPF